MAGDLHRRHADAARRRVDQHLLPRPETGQVHQSVVRGQERHRHRRGLRERPPLGDGRELTVVGDGQGAERAAVEHAHHPLTHGHAGHAWADLGDDAGALQAHGAGLPRVHAEGVEHVAEVDSRRADGDPYLAVRQRRDRFGGGYGGEAVEAALVLAVHPPRVGRNGECGGHTGEPGRLCLAFADADLVLSCGERGQQRFGVEVFAGGVTGFGVLGQEEQAGMLGLG